MSPEIRSFLSEAMRKRRLLIEKGMISTGGSYVIIEDLNLDNGSGTPPPTE